MTEHIHISRPIELIILHHSATPPSMDIGADEIDGWHRERGFSKIGYHEVIRKSGAIEAGRDRSEEGAHCMGHNKHSIGICLIGDGRVGFTREQYLALGQLLGHYKMIVPHAKVIAHREIAPTLCPGMTSKEILDYVEAARR